ncbi:MAG: hypothetical protein AAF731_11955 [Bacteroidota bacterium]
MKTGILTLIFLTNFYANNAWCMRISNNNDNKALIEALLKERNYIDTLFSKDELVLIEEIKQSLDKKITVLNVDLQLKACYFRIAPILNEYKKQLQGISKKLLVECLIAHSGKTSKKDIEKLEFITSPLPLILLVDDRFMNLIEL